MKNRVAEFLLVIAKVAKDMDNTLTKTSRDVMDELKELKEYVENSPSPPVCFAHVHNLKVSCSDYLSPSSN